MKPDTASDVVYDLAAFVRTCTHGGASQQVTSRCPKPASRILSVLGCAVGAGGGGGTDAICGHGTYGGPSHMWLQVITGDLAVPEFGRSQPAAH